MPPLRSALVINATGLGKDAPGSPLTFDGPFPRDGVVWELNYRGDLVFLDQARAQQAEKAVQIEDGWTYFIHGWTQVIATATGANDGDRDGVRRCAASRSGDDFDDVCALGEGRGGTKDKGA